MTELWCSYLNIISIFFTGWTYLHLIADQYYLTDDIVCQRIMVRCIYKLALLGINVNSKDASGKTCLLKGFKLEDQSLARHLITIGELSRG